MAFDELTPAEPAKRLYAELFDRSSPEEIASTAARGIEAIVENIDRLLSDVDFLLADKRYATASFLLATAQEEVAKIFILIDTCRLDPSKYASVLRSLCKAFYSHIAKHAYNEVRRIPIIHDMGQAADRWRIAVRRWWPGSSDPQDGEPAMPHDTVFDREVPLYVDWDYWSRTWIVPRQSTNRLKFDNAHWPSELDRFRAELQTVKEAAAKGLLSAEALKTVNTIYGGTYIGDSTPMDTIHKLEEKLVASVSSKLSLSDADILKSPLVALPLYHFTTVSGDAA